MLPTVAVDDWVAARLALTVPGGPVGLGDVFPDFPPQGVTDFPCIVYALLAAPVLRAVGPDRVHCRATYLVKVVAPGEAYEPLRPYRTWIDGQLQVGASAPFAGAVVSGDLVEEVRYRDVADDGVVWLHDGARYVFDVPGTAL